MASRSTGIFNTLRNKKKIGKKREAHRSFSDLSIQEPQMIFNGHNFIPLTPSDQPPNLPFIKPQDPIPHIPVVRTISNQSDDGRSGEDKAQKYREKGLNNIKELIQTERNYIENLKSINSFYKYVEESTVKTESNGVEEPLQRKVSVFTGHAIVELERPKAPLPVGLSDGRSRICFGNSQDILEFHQRTILPAFEKCLDDVKRLETVFAEKKDHLKVRYGKYCMNHPKVGYILNEFDVYFNLVRMALDSEQPLEVLLMTPVQRPIQIKTLLEKIAECFQKAGEDEIYNSVKAALKISDEINKYSNDMMKAGRIRNFEHGPISKQGILLHTGDAICYKKFTRKMSTKKKKPRECMVFIFRETVIICDKVTDDQPYSPQLFNYWNSFQMNKLAARPYNCKEDGCKMCFELERLHSDTARKSEETHVIVECKDVETMERWIKIITKEIADLKRGADIFSNPKLFQ